MGVSAVTVRQIDNLPTRCPPLWKRGKYVPRKSIFDRFDDDGLYPEQQDLCQLKYFDVCATKIFATAVEDNCNKVQLLARFKEISKEFSRLAVSGEGDRNCIFHITLVPCDLINFHDISDPAIFFDQFNRLANSVFLKCGKQNFEDKWRPKVETLTSLVDQVCQRNVDTIPETDTVTITVAPVVTTTTLAPVRATKGYTTLST